MVLLEQEMAKLQKHEKHIEINVRNRILHYLLAEFLDAQDLFPGTCTASTAHVVHLPCP
jgi:hypothetical protein